jgi:hypothetical protein
LFRNSFCYVKEIMKILYPMSWFLVCLMGLSTPSIAEETKLARPWIKPVKAGWTVTPLLNVGDKVGEAGYRMVGVPDGLGVLANGDATLSVFMNHELAAEIGKLRAHSSRGAFVSRWVLDVNTLKVVHGDDLIRKVALWLPEKHAHVYAATYSFNRLCSADLPKVSALYDKKTGKGFDGRLFLNGEENRAGGRAFAHVVTGDQTGVSYELPHLGKFSWENVVANPDTGVKTVVMGMDDSPDGQVYVYVGEKRAAGNPAELAGLVGGNLSALKVDGKRFKLANLGDVSAMSGADLEQAGHQAGVTNFMRPEDGAWDVNNHNIFYFATTDKFDGNSQLFQLIFDDVQHPEQGGAISVVLNARDIGAQMFDNITVAGDGKLLIEEDPGDNPHAAAIWQFDLATGKADKILAVVPELFVDKNSPDFMTQDEENSGITEITDLVGNAIWAKPGRRYFIGVLQVHAKNADPELVEDGQLYLIESP